MACEFDARKERFWELEFNLAPESVLREYIGSRHNVWNYRMRYGLGGWRRSVKVRQLLSKPQPKRNTGDRSPHDAYYHWAKYEPLHQWGTMKPIPGSEEESRKYCPEKLIIPPPHPLALKHGEPTRNGLDYILQESTG